MNISNHSMEELIEKKKELCMQVVKGDNLGPLITDKIMGQLNRVMEEINSRREREENND